MKKLSIVLGMMLVLVVAGTSSAIKFTVEPAAPVIGEGDTAEVCMYLDDWPDLKGVAGVDYYFTYNQAAAMIMSVTADPIWDDSNFVDSNPAPGSALVGVIDYSLLGNTGTKIKLQCVVIHCLDGDVDFNFGVSLGADGIVLDVDGGEYTDVTAASIPIDQTPPPPCGCTVAPNPATLQSGVTPSQVLTVTTTGICANTPSYTWVEDCTQASLAGPGPVNPNTISLDPGIIVDQNCTVTVTDAANTIGTPPQNVQCTGAIEVLAAAACKLKIYRGGTCERAEEIIDPAYNRPGRRGLALTCCEEVTFCLCSNCNPEIDCPVWTFEVVEGDTSITLVTVENPDGSWTLHAPCPCPDTLTTIEVCVTDPPSGIVVPDCVYVQVGRVLLDIGETNAHPDTASIDVAVSLINPDHYVKALEFTIQECGNDAPDNLACYECDADEDRAPNFFCSAVEQLDGTCKVTMWTTENSLIARGSGPILSVKFNVGEGYTSKDCICLEPANIKTVDQFNESLCGGVKTGEVCFYICGDIYPQDCYQCASCGDGVVDLFDILEEIDIILGLQPASACQMLHGNVPPGMPPYCGTPSGETNCDTGLEEIDIFDAVVIIDKALGKMNCCDYCFFGKIS